MRKIVAFFVRNSLFGDLLTLFVIVVGVISLFLIRREVFPNVSYDVVSVNTIYPGASPEEVEKLVTNPLEQEILEVDGIKKIVSTSVEGRSGIGVYLDPDQTTGSEGKREIEDAVDRVTDIPAEAEDTVITEMESKQAPIIEVALASNIPEVELREVAKKLEREIEGISGVARVVHKGLRDVEIRVEVSRKKLKQYRLSLEDVVHALKLQNLSIPGGPLKPLALNEKEIIVRTVGDFSTLEDVGKTVIRANDLGQAIQVKDVAHIFFDLERASTLFRTGGVPSFNLTVLKKEKADAIKVVSALKKKLQELRPYLPKDLSISYVNDMSIYIERRLNILTSNFGLGLILVLILLPLMIPFRFSLIIGLGEPFAFLGAFIILYFMGASINLVSLLGLIMVSGILVDDSIVVTENAVRLIEEKGFHPEKAAIEGTMQIMGPVMASICTTSMAFLPLMFMTGIFGKFIREIPMGILTCMVVSLFETFFILPGHIAHWIDAKRYSRKFGHKPPNQNFLRRTLWSIRDFWDHKITPLYLQLLRFTLRFRYGMAVLLLLLCSGTFYLATQKMRFILFPPEGVEVFFIRVESHNGASLEQTQENLKPLEQLVKKLPASELDAFTTSVGIIQQDPHDPNTKRGSEYGQITVFLTPENNRQRLAGAIIQDLRQQIGHPKNLLRVTFDRVNPGPPMGKPVSLGVRAEHYHDILPAVRDLKGLLKDLPGVQDISDSYTLGKEEVRIQVKGPEAAAAHLSVATIGNSVRAAFEGLVATTVRHLSEKIDVRVSLPKEERTQISSLEDLTIPNPLGNLIPLSRVAKLTKAQGPSSFQHEENQREVKVTAEVETNVTTATIVNNKIRQVLPQFRKLHPNIQVDFGGEDEDTQESLKSLVRSFFLAVLGIFLTLVLVFRQIFQSLLILITIPLGIISVIWAFFLHGMPLSFMGMIGMIALGGVIVNNAIILMDFVNQARKEGKGNNESIEEAAKIRVRPIFLTTITTVIGVLPTAYGIGGVDKFVVPIAMALGWGLLFGSVLTAFIFPSALAILDDFNGLVRRIFPRFSQFYHPPD